MKAMTGSIGRRRFAGVGVVLLAFLGLLLWKAAGPGEPAYQGKTLSRWLEGYVPSAAVEPPYTLPSRDEADEAVRRIGTNAIPVLLQKLRAKDPPKPVLNLLELARLQGLPGIRFQRAVYENEAAEYAFQALGANGAPAVPELIKIYEQAHSASSQRCAALALGNIGPEAERAIPMLLKNFAHTNDCVRRSAVAAVLNIGGEPSLVVPAIRGLLKDPSVKVRWKAIEALGRFGRQAESAVPDLIALLKRPSQLGDKSLRQQAKFALWCIAPEKLGLAVLE